MSRPLTVDLVVVIDGEARPIYDPARGRFWHRAFYRLVDAGWPQADARDEVDRRWKESIR